LNFKSETTVTKFLIKKNPKKQSIEVKEDDKFITKYKYFTPNKKVIIPQEVISSLEGKEKEIFESGSSVDVNIVLELSKNNRVKPIDDAKLYLFYPLQISSGFRFIIHSYFIVNPERTALRDSTLNDFLLSLIGQFIGTEMLRTLKKSRANTTNILCFKRNEDAKIKTLYDSLVSELKNQKFVYDNQTKRYFYSSDIIVADGFDKGLFPDGKLGGKQLVYTDDDEVIEWLRKEFDVSYLTYEEIANEIENECKRQSKLKNVKFFQNLYNYVSKNEKLNLTGRKVLLTTNWKLVSSEEDVFYGGGKRKPLHLAPSIKKQIYFIHKEIKITDFREGRSRTGITEFNTYELIRRLLNLFNIPSVPNTDLLNALYNLYPFDSKSELEIKEKIILPIKGRKKWQSPLSNPIYFETKNIKELYPNGNFIDTEIFKPDEIENQISKQEFFKTYGVWEIPATYISNSIRTNSTEKREELIIQYSGLTSRPFYIKNDRAIDKPTKYSNWFTSSILDNWSKYKAFITSSLIPKIKYNSSQGYYDRTSSEEQLIPLSGFIETLRTEKWIVFSGEESSFAINEIIGINLLDFSQSHNQVIGRYLKLLPINYLNKKDLIEAVGLLHLDGDSIDNFIKLLSFIYKKYEINIPEGKDFIDFYNRILGKLVDFYYFNHQSESIEYLKNVYFLCIDDISKERYWKKANQIFYIDDKANYDILPNSIKEKVQPNFTNRDKNRFGKIAGQIGRRFSNSIKKELIESEIIQTETLPNYLKNLPECLAILESLLNTNIDDHFEKITQIRVFVCSKLDVKISVDNSQELIIPINQFVDTDSNLDIHLSKPNDSSKNKQIAESLNELFINLLNRDMGAFSANILLYLNSQTKKEFLKIFDISEERVNEIRNGLSTSYHSPAQKFWDAVLNAKGIGNRQNIFTEKQINFQTLSELLEIEMIMLNKIQSNFDFHITSNQENITLLSNLLNRISLPLKTLNQTIFPKIDFRDYYEKKVIKLKNNFEKGFDSIMHIYLSNLDVEAQSNYQDYIDSYKFNFHFHIPLNIIDLDIEIFFLKELNNQFDFLNIKKDDFIKNYITFNSIQFYNANFKVFKSKITSIKFSKENLETYFTSNKNRSLLYFNNTEYLVNHFIDWLKQNKEQHKPFATEEDLTDFLKEYSSNGNTGIETITTNQVEISNSNNKNQDHNGKGSRFDGSAGAQSKKQIGLIAEMAVFEELNSVYRNVIWASKYASKIPKDHIGYNPEGQDGLGYDIEYLDTNGNKFFIEVKGKSDNYESFEISRNEINKAHKEGEYFKIIFVSETMNVAKRRIRDLGNLFLLENGEDFFSNRNFTAIYKNFEIRFQEE